MCLPFVLHIMLYFMQQTGIEYAHSELEASLTTKRQCEDHTLQIEKQARKLGQHLKGKRVKLVGLTQNVKWNGRTGVIVKLVVEGEDCGRWKVRLEKERRGGDPDGMDERDSLNGEVRGDGNRPKLQQRRDGNEKSDDQNLASHHVVAKAENLQLLDACDPIGLDGVALNALSSNSMRSRSRSNKSRTSRASDFSNAKSRDPSSSRHSEDFEVCSPHSNNVQRHAVTVTPDHNVTSPQSNMASPLSPPEIMSPKRNGKELSSAFSNMLLSPVSFEHVSFTAVPSDSFASPKQQIGRHTKMSDRPITESSFNEATPQEGQNESLQNVQGQYQNQYQPNQDQCHQSIGESHRGYPQEIYSTDLPTLVILPVQEDSNNGCNSPHCIGVQGAGVPHINGVYVLANDGSPSSPLYFRDSPPTLLEDDRYYGKWMVAKN